MILKKINEIAKNKVFLKYLKNTSWLFVSKIFSFISVIFINVYIANYLGPDKYGLLIYSSSIVIMFLPIAMIGLNDIVVKELVKIKEKVEINNVLGTAFFLKLIFGLVSLILLIILVLTFQDDYQTRYLIAIFSFYLLLQSLEVLDFFFQSEVKSRFVVYGRIIALLVTGIIKILLIVYEAELALFAFAMVLELLLTHIVVLWFFYKNGFSFFSWKFKKSLAKSLLKRSWPLFLSGLMFVIYIKIDQIMVKEILGNHSAGVYAVAITLSEAWYFIPNIIVSSLFPAILLAKKGKQEVYHKKMINLYSFLFWAAIIISIIITFFGDFIISYLYGKAYDGASLIFKIYIWSNVFFFINVLSSKWLVTEGYYLHSFYRNIIGAIINVLLNFFLISKYGLTGAAISTLISYSVVAIFYDLFFKELRINLRLKLKSMTSIV
jgi:O-antigen/teichoic acid export membrane protein